MSRPAGSDDGQLKASNLGRVIGISGPLIVAEGLVGASMHEVVNIGLERLIGEVIRLEGSRQSTQVFESSQGLRVGDIVEATGSPLSIELGPGLLGLVIDGIGRPLARMAAAEGRYVRRGSRLPTLDPDAIWEFVPSVGIGAVVEDGDPLGYVQETQAIRHLLMTPSGFAGVVEAVHAGQKRVHDLAVRIRRGDGSTADVNLATRWPVRIPRPFGGRIEIDEPLLTGQRVIDTFFPLAKGGVAVIPGGFGTGKTVLQQMLAKMADADVVLYVGCGERGNEMNAVLEEFPKLRDRATGRPLLERMVLVANTSDMPVAAREASIYTGITIAEYYRDMGFNVALMADSTSRWAEAVREVSGRLGEVPGEEGYPAYLNSRLAAFYERAGAVTSLGRKPRKGSITVVGAVSPPGGDFSEPVTRDSLRIAGTFWALDSGLAHRRHFPAINWLTSYSLYTKSLRDWFLARQGPDWESLTERASAILQEESELREIVRLVGADTLSEEQRLALWAGQLIREVYLQQSAVDTVDAYCEPAKQRALLHALLAVRDVLAEAIAGGTALRDLTRLDAIASVSRLRWADAQAIDAELDETCGQVRASVDKGGK